MSGPIVRSGPSKQFSANWDSVFGNKAAKPKKTAAKPAKRKAAKRKKSSA